VEAVLASRPEERRALVEEAAGLGRFKRRRHRAELKLARVARDVERARDLEQELSKRLRPLALQASAAERAEKLAVEIAQVRAAAIEHVLAEREGLPPAARALAEQGERLALDSLDPAPGDERAVAAALGHRAAALLADDPDQGLALLERARSAGLGSLVVLVGRDPREVVAELPVVPLRDLLDSTGPAVTREGFGYDPDRGEL